MMVRKNLRRVLSKALKILAFGVAGRPPAEIVLLWKAAAGETNAGNDPFP
jgi:hypothetical protein